MQVVRDFYEMRTRLFFAALLSVATTLAFGQAASAPVQKSSDILNPALSQVKQTVNSLNISKWKAPGEVKSAMQQNADSIIHDVDGVLPGLLGTADGAPNSVAAGFPVYRNIDALYDVLLRLSLTANLAAPKNEDDAVSASLRQLEMARTSLSNNIVALSSQNESDLIKLRTDAQRTVVVHENAPAKTTVVNDGPSKSTTSTVKKKKKPAAPVTPATTPPANSQ